MNKLSTEKRAQILGMMVEGMSIRAITRLTGVSKNTVAKFLADAGEAFGAYQDKTLRSLPCKRIQCDEIWAFCGSREKNVRPENKGVFGHGDIWTWTALCADTKLMVSWMVADRDLEAATEFIGDVASRLANRVQLTTDGHSPYITAVEEGFRGQIDYGMLIKVYSSSPMGGRYAAGNFIRSETRVMNGNPDRKHISTSYVERSNLSLRMGNRRMTRLTNAFSKKAENHAHAMAIYFMHYNFGRIHKTLRVTPAMEAGIAKSPMSFEDMVAIIDAATPPPGPRGPYKKKLLASE